MVEAALQRLVPHLDALSQSPAADTDFEASADAAEAFSLPFPELGRELESMLDRLFDDAIPRSLNTASPGYLAYIPGGGLPLAAVADLIANAINRYVGVWVAAPVLVRLEADVCRGLLRATNITNGEHIICGRVATKTFYLVKNEEIN